MGAGSAFDDFPRSDFLAEIIRGYGRDPYRWLAIDLVFNGDTFDLLKTSFRGGYPHHVTREVAIDKMERVAAAHPAFFDAVREFLSEDRMRRRVHFIVGNHDMELLFPEVQTLIRERVGSFDSIHFPGFSMSLGRLHVEHGSQLDPLFRVNPEEPFVTGPNGEMLLALSWASVALLDVAIPLQPIFYHHDRLKPKELVLKLIPEARELLTSEFWTYWTRSYWRDLWSGSDPLKTMKSVSWTMLKELVVRMASWDVEVEMGDHLQRRMIESDAYDLYIVGHQHEPGWWSHGQRKVLRTGCMRDEFMLHDDGEVQVPINKTWAEAYLAGEQVVRSHLVEVPSPLRPPNTMPSSIFDCRDEVRARLKARPNKAVEQAEQERRERET